VEDEREHDPIERLVLERQRFRLADDPPNCSRAGPGCSRANATKRAELSTPVTLAEAA
jgi:hypothetical protein